MRDQSVDLLGSSIPQNARGESDGVAGVDHVIDKNGNLSLDIADQQLHLLQNALVLVTILRA